MTTTASTPSDGPHPASSTDPAYHALEKQVAARVAGTPGPFFTTEVLPDWLWSAWLEGIPPMYRQWYTCRSCQRFIQTSGGLVPLDEKGVANSLCWGSWCGLAIPDFFLTAMLSLVDDKRSWEASDEWPKPTGLRTIVGALREIG